jgi:hypothetical protein
MTVHNCRFSLEERVATFVDTKHSIYTALPSSGLQLPCLSDTQVTHHSLWCLFTHTTLQPYKWTFWKKNLNTSSCIIIADLLDLAISLLYLISVTSNEISWLHSNNFTDIFGSFPQSTEPTVGTALGIRPQSLPSTHFHWTSHKIYKNTLMKSLRHPPNKRTCIK